MPVPDPLVAGQVFLVAGLPGESLIALPAAPGGRRALYKYILSVVDPDSLNPDQSFKVFSHRECSGSVTFWCRSGSGSSDQYLSLKDPALALVTFKTPTKINFFSLSFNAYSFFEGTFRSFFKDKKSYRSHKTVVIKVFLNFLAR